ncbi:MAG TPA: DedA family protein [Candidatus Paceibacterota bacterium]|nr:DedA family protein [Candidatus Paceibacterota bacterium]
MLNSLIAAVVSLISTAGYGGLFLWSALESAAVPIPSEIVLPFSGFLVSSGQFNFWTVVIVATVANVCGSLALFYVGRSGGRWLLERYGRFVLIHHDDLDTWDAWFKKHGPATVFWSRVLPVVRTFVSLPAGIAEMNVGRFALYTTLGALPWNFVLTYAGYKAGQNWDYLHPYFQRFDYLIGLIVILAVILYIWRHVRKMRKAS